MLRKTKLVCTIGPASNSSRVIERLVRAGMNVARLNFSYGSLQEHAETISIIRDVSNKLRIPVAILLDLPGPRLRIGRLENEEVHLNENDHFSFISERVLGNQYSVSVDFLGFFNDIAVGDNIFLKDGAIQLEVTSNNNTEVKCKVVIAGLLTGYSGINVPGVKLTIPPVRSKDLEILAFALAHSVDFIAVSFVRSAADVLKIKQLLQESEGSIPIIAKIENQEAVNNIDGIVAEANGIMVARGDLGVEIYLEKVPIVQKEIIRKCNQAGKPVIVATQMLESMIGMTRPTRAEVSDVANAIIDGTDAVMLSGETAIGRHPVQTVKMMVRIIAETEKALPYDRILREKSEQVTSHTDDAISYAACHISQQLRAACIIAYTNSGSTALRVSKYRPKVPIMAITPNDNIVRRLVLSWGIEPYLVTELVNADMMFQVAAELAYKMKFAKRDELVVITAGIPTGTLGSTNMVKVHRVE